MDCTETSLWIWESLRDHEDPPAGVAEHIAGCPSCESERAARVAVARDLYGLRHEFEDDLPEGMDERVLAAAHGAVAARETGRFRFEGDLEGIGADLDPDTLSEIEMAIARDLADTGRVAIRPEWQLPPEPPADLPPLSTGWEPPRATPGWMVAASMLLGASLLIGFQLGRLSVPEVPAVHATLATTTDGIVLKGMPRVHSVGLSPEAVDTLNKGNTYLLSGPLGGPYEVMGVVRWDDTEFLPVPASSDERGEIVVAVGPAGGWSKGKRLALNDLSASDVEILGRRAIDRER
jgi:hypothetical protein